MITKMKKLTFLVYYKDYESFLEHLRDLGVVHIEEKQKGTVEDAGLQENLKLLGHLKATLKQINYEDSIAGDGLADTGRGRDALEEMDLLSAEKMKLTQQLQSLKKEAEALELWGDFDPQNITKLREVGYQINFYICSEKQFKEEWIEDYHAVQINKAGSKIYFLTVTHKEVQPDIDVETVKMPATSLSALKNNIKSVEHQIYKIEEELHRVGNTNYLSMQALQKELSSNIEFSKVVLNTEQYVENKLMLLQGWVPAGMVSSVTEYLDKENAYFELTAPTPDDNVPIQLSNKGFFRLFEPICKLYMLPKYNEIDLTPFFAPFFMVFFGLCLGDSGYGLFMVLAVALYRMLAKNISASMKPVLTLVQILGVFTFFCGLLTGTFFGFNIYGNDIPFFNNMRDLLYLDNQWMFNLSLILGAVQIVFGMILKVANQTIQFGFKYAIATVGWIVLLVSMALAYMLPSVMPMGGTVHLIVMAVAAVMIFLFNSPGKNIFVNIGLGLWDSYNMATGLLGDILSYVRLFALGLSGGILASVFNSLAVGMSPDHAIFGPIVMVLIFLIGHSINMFMNVLGAMVHPMRLTFVEFFKNSGYEGGGKEYKPFKN